jgi:hypothetical protein
MFVDMPGSEWLAMDPEVLLLREGVLLNKSLLDFSRGEKGLTLVPSSALHAHDTECGIVGRSMQAESAWKGLFGQLWTPSADE